MANPALDYTAQPIAPVWGLHEWGQSWGSESRNIPIGYIEHRKPRWQVLKYKYEDPGALERFGIDPRNPAQGGMIMSANSYGYPLQGFTTGYSVKMPPSNIGMEAASQVPRSGLDMTVVGISNGATPDPVDVVNDMNSTTKAAMTLPTEPPLIMPTTPVSAPVFAPATPAPARKGGGRWRGAGRGGRENLVVSHD